MITFVGSNPSVKNPDPKIPFAGTRSGKVLRSWIEATTDRDPDTFRFVNLSDEVTEGNRPLKMSEVDRDNLIKKLEGSHRIVALGHTASQVLSKLRYPHLELPHPSPRNRVLNSREKVQETLDKLRDFLKPGPRLQPKNWYGFNHEVVRERFEGDLTYVCELPLTLKTGRGEIRLPASLYKAANPNRDKGHKEYMALFRNGDGLMVTGRELPELSKDRYVYGMRCLECDDVIFSMTRHDFTRCSCGACFVDGGTDYFRAGAKSFERTSKAWIDLMTGEIFDPATEKFGELERAQDAEEEARHQEMMRRWNSEEEESKGT